jgi:hypothetical protein
MRCARGVFRWGLKKEKKLTDAAQIAGAAGARRARRDERGQDEKGLHHGLILMYFLLLGCFRRPAVSNE